MKYVVVEFCNEGTVGVVVNTWLVQKKKGSFSYWPRNGVENKVRKREPPDYKTWSLHAVRIIKRTDVYEKALQYAKDAEDTDNIQSEADADLLLTKRASSKPEHLAEYTHDGEESDCEDCNDEESNAGSTESEGADQEMYMCELPTPPMKVAKVTSTSSPRTAKISGPQKLANKSSGTAQGFYADDHEDLSQNEDDLFPNMRSPRSTIDKAKKSPPAGPKSPNGPKSPPAGPRSTLNPGTSRTTQQSAVDGGPLQLIPMELRKIQETQERHGVIQSRLDISNGPLGDDLGEEILDEPIKTLEEMDAFNAKLEDDQAFRKKVVHYLSTVGGASAPIHVRLMMKKVRGQKGKKCLQALPLMRVLIKTCMRIHKKKKLFQQLGTHSRRLPIRGVVINSRNLHKRGPIQSPLRNQMQNEKS